MADRVHRPNGHLGFLDVGEGVGEVAVVFFQRHERGRPLQPCLEHGAADQVRPPQFRDITDEPLPAITPCSWTVREPVFFVTVQPRTGGGPVQRLFRLVRETPVEWVEFQPGVFRFAFVMSDDRRAVCVLDLWKTLVVAVAAPWPDRRGPMRRGKRNPLSRDGRH